MIIYFLLLAAREPKVPISLPPVQADTLVEIKEGGRIDWTSMVIRAKGWAVIDTTGGKSYAQAKLMAIRGAKMVAYRNLLEIIQGVNVVSETKVKDMTAKSDYIYTRIEGVVKGARMVGEPVEKDGIIEVEMEVSMYDSSGVAPVLWNELTKGKTLLMGAGAKVDEELKKVKSIIIDAGGTKAKPGFFPRILDKNGNVLFDPSKYYKPGEYEFLIKYAKKAKETAEKLGVPENSWVIKVLDAKGSDIIIEDKDRGKIEKIKKGINFLIKAGKLIWMLL